MNIKKIHIIPDGDDMLQLEVDHNASILLSIPGNRFALEVDPHIYSEWYALGDSQGIAFRDSDGALILML